MKRYLVLLVSVWVLGSVGCTSTVDDSVTGQTSADAGQLQLMAMKGLNKVSTSLWTTDTSSTYVFDLDSIKSSSQYYFLLQNTGKRDVYNIQIKSNNPAFTFSPSKIAVLPPSKDAFAQQLIKLDVVHGVRLDGVGAADLLPMGKNSASIAIVGNTTNSHNESLDLSVSAQLSVFAKVMSFTAFQGPTPLNLLSPTYWSFGAGMPMNTPEFRGLDSACHIINTGNVDIIVRTWVQPVGTQTMYVIDSATVAPGVRYYPTVFSPSSSSSNRDDGSVQFDGQGTVNVPAIPNVLDGRIFARFQGTGNHIKGHF